MAEETKDREAPMTLTGSHMPATLMGFSERSAAASIDERLAAARKALEACDLYSAKEINNIIKKGRRKSSAARAAMASTSRPPTPGGVITGTTTVRLQGKVRSFVSKNATFTLVEADGGVYFAHWSAFQQVDRFGDFGIVYDRHVTFLPGKNDKGLCAVDIRLDPIPDGFQLWRKGKKGREYGGCLADSDTTDDPKNLKPLGYRRVLVLAADTLRGYYKAVLQPLAKNAAEAQLFYEGKGTTELWSTPKDKVGVSTDVPGHLWGVRKLVVDRLDSLLDEPDAAEKYFRGGTPDDRLRRLEAAKKLVKSLKRGADSGPDGPLQCFGHAEGELRKARYTRVTGASMIELFDKLGSILELLFQGRHVPTGVSVRAVTFALRAALDAPSIDPAKVKKVPEGDPNGRPSKKQAHNNPVDVFNGLVAAWHVLPSTVPDVIKEQILSFLPLVPWWPETEED
jgi:hypothetical protein